MGVNFKLIFILTGLIFILSSCRTSAPRLDYQALARASILLGVDINMEDNHKLYLESAEWIGVPYRGGGDSKRGTDCSGLTYQIYRKVYRVMSPKDVSGSEYISNMSFTYWEVSGSATIFFVRIPSTTVGSN